MKAIDVEAGQTGGIFNYSFYVTSITVDGVRYVFRERTEISDITEQRIKNAHYMPHRKDVYEKGVKAALNFIKKNGRNIVSATSV